MQKKKLSTIYHLPTPSSAYTLIELLIVMAIIALLAVVLMVVINPVEMGRRSRDTKRLSDIGTLKSAIDLALADKTATLQVTAAGGNVLGTDVDNFAGLAGFKIGKYLSVIPVDPKGGVSTVVVADAACTTTSVTPTYRFWSDGNTYILRSNVESKTNCASAKGDGNSNGTYEVGTEPGLNAF